MRKSLGEKRKQLDDDQIADIVRLYGAFEENGRCKILPNEAFGFMRITVERPMRRVWTVTDDQIDQVKAHRTFDKLGKPKKGEDPSAGQSRQEALIAAFGDTRRWWLAASTVARPKSSQVQQVSPPTADCGRCRPTARVAVRPDVSSDGD